MADEGIEELAASGKLSEYSGTLPPNLRHKLKQEKLRADDEFVLEDIFSERMLALATNAHVEEVTDDNMDDRLIKPSYERPVLVDIYSDDIVVPGNHVLPVVYQLADKYRDQLKFVKINAGRNRNFASSFLGRAQMTPAFLFFKDGRPFQIGGSRLGRLLGQRAFTASTRAGLERRIESVLHSQVK